MAKKYLLTDNEVIDNLTSTAENKPLSANQGRTLNTTKISMDAGHSDQNFQIACQSNRVSVYGDDYDVALFNADGDTMQGDITMGDHSIKFGDNNKEIKADGDNIKFTGNIEVKGNSDFSIHNDSNSTYLGLSGSTGESAYDGCVMFLTGKDQPDWHGGFGIRTGNGNSSESKTLSGNPNGELKWNNKRVETSTINTTSLSVSGEGGFSATISAQRCIEHELYYEYYIVLTISGTFSTAYQDLVCTIYGLQGTQLYTHEPCPVWCEGGGGTEQGLFYGSSVYIGACPTSPDKDRRVKIHTMRMK